MQPLKTGLVHSEIPDTLITLWTSLPSQHNLHQQWHGIITVIVIIIIIIFIIVNIIIIINININNMMMMMMKMMLIAFLHSIPVTIKFVINFNWKVLVVRGGPIYPLSEWGICLFSRVVFAPPQKSRPQPGASIKMGLELPLSLTDKDGGCFQGKVHCSLGPEGWPSQWFIFIKNTGWVYMFCQWQTFFGQKCDKESVGWAGWQTGGQTLVHAQLQYLFPHVSCQRQL